MKLIANREDCARPLLGRPADKPDDGPKKRVLTEYRRNGTVIKVRLKQSLCEALENTQGHLVQASGRTFSQPIIARRALDLYAKSLVQMNPSALTDEASVLMSQYR